MGFVDQTLSLGKAGHQAAGFVQPPLLCLAWR
jgi:hypothetical protein